MPEYKLQRFRGGWALAIYDGGERISRRKLGPTDPAEAAREYEAIVAQLKKPQSPSITRIWDDFAAARQGRPIATTMGFERKAVLAHFGDKTPDDINDATCQAYAERRREAGRKDGTIWTELGHLRTALRWAAEAKMIERAPAILRPMKPDPKDRFLTRDEAEQLLAAATMPHIRLFIILAVTTAARAGALLDLKWERCDFDRGMIYLGERNVVGIRKKGRATVPMNDTARAALLESRRGARSDYVIEWAGGRVTKLRRGIQSTAKRAGLAEVTPHVLRHTAAVWMAEAGRPMAEIAQYLGHSDSRITERVYARYSPEHLRKAAGALEFGKLRSV